MNTPKLKTYTQTQSIKGYPFQRDHADYVYWNDDYIPKGDKGFIQGLMNKNAPVYVLVSLTDVTNGNDLHSHIREVEEGKHFIVINNNGSKSVKLLDEINSDWTLLTEFDIPTLP